MSIRFAINPGGAQIDSLATTLRRPSELPKVAEFRIGAYNVHNLFGEDAEKPAEDEQLEALGEMIRNLNADAIAFEEVQNEAVLRKLFREQVNNKLSKEEQYDGFVWVPANDRRGINVALATRLSVRGAMTFHDREFGPADDRAVRFSRDLLGVDINATPDYRFLFFVAHLKSKIGGDPAEEKRGIEASEIRSILEEPTFGGNGFIHQDVVVAGDMNDDPDTRVIGIFTEGGKLTDILAPLGKPTYPTHKKYKKTRLDYIFTSPTMTKRVRDPEVHHEDPAAVASDHYPVSATIRVVTG